MKQFNDYLQQKGYSKSTRSGTIKETERFIQWLEANNIPQEQVRYNDVMNYVKMCQKKGNSQRTVQIRAGKIKIWYNYLIDINQATDNPAAAIKIRGIKRRKLYDIFKSEELETIYKNHPANTITEKRNKIILGLIIYQGLRTEELMALLPKDINLREGKINIESQRRTNYRELQLEAHQIIDIQEYITRYRPILLELTGKQSDKLFVSSGVGSKLHNTLAKLKKQIQKQNPRVKELEQLRVSVITNWLKYLNLRKTQYLAGHRYVSSTEAYQMNDVEGLQEEINKYHPIG